MFLSRGEGYLKDLPELHEACHVPFPEGMWDYSEDTALEKGLILH